MLLIISRRTFYKSLLSLTVCYPVYIFEQIKYVQSKVNCYRQRRSLDQYLAVAFDYIGRR